MSRTFCYTLQGETIHEDPLKIRRGLLVNTEGRAWEYARDLSILSKELEEWKWIEPTIGSETDEDKGKLKECQAQIAVHRTAIAKLEGMLAEATFEAFEFKPLDSEDGSGVTELEALEVLKQFLEYAEGKG